MPAASPPVPPREARWRNRSHCMPPARTRRRRRLQASKAYSNELLSVNGPLLPAAGDPWGERGNHGTDTGTSAALKAPKPPELNIVVPVLAGASIFTFKPELLLCTSRMRLVTH